MLFIFFFSKNISIYTIFNYQSFNNMFTNDIVSFEKQGPKEMMGNLRNKCKSYLLFFSKNISIYTIFNDQSFNMFTNYIVSFEKQGPEETMGNLRDTLLYAYNKVSNQLVFSCIVIKAFLDRPHYPVTASRQHSSR